MSTTDTDHVIPRTNEGPPDLLDALANNPEYPLNSRREILEVVEEQPQDERFTLHVDP